MLKDIFSQIGKNEIFMATIYAWVIAQTIKVSLGVIYQKRFDFRWLIGTGGMPSTHTAGACCLATATGLKLGFDSIYFAIAASFALVVMFDAQVIRRTAGKQARILNKIMEDIYWQGRIQENRLRELIGHTPVEVIAGFLLGVIVAFIFIKPN
jgi:acid phosphatase family membrane protein YuiD